MGVDWEGDSLASKLTPHSFFSVALAIYWSVSAGSSAMAILATQSFVQAFYCESRRARKIEEKSEKQKLIPIPP